MQGAGQHTDRRICVGQFAGAHGVRGLAKLRSFTEDPEAIFAYAPLTAEDGREVSLALKSADGDMFLVSVEGVASREAAEDLRGDRLFISREQLPPTREGEYYQSDIIGMSVTDQAGKTYGKVMAFHDYGAGVFLEIGNSRKDSFMLPFKNEFVPTVDLAAGRITVVLPEGWVGDKEDKKGA